MKTINIEAISTIADFRNLLFKTLDSALKELATAEANYRTCAIASRAACDSLQGFAVGRCSLGEYRELANKTDQAYVAVRDLRDRTNALHDRIFYLDRQIAESGCHHEK